MIAMRAVRMTRGPIALTAALSLSAALLISTASVTDASWEDSEWVSGTLGTADCTDPAGGFSARGSGRALSGSIVGIDLDQLAEASGVTVINDGDTTQTQPSGALPAVPSPDAFADPLNVTALKAANIDLGGGILKLPLNTDTGVLGQYGRASSSGVATAASGYVTNSGGIDLDSGTAYPEMGSLNLSSLLAAINPAVAGTLSDIVDASLEIGALAGRAHIDGCALVWGAEPAEAVVRDYLATSINMQVASDTVGALASGVNGVVTTLADTVSGLADNTDFLDGLVTAVADLLNPLLGLLGLGEITVDSFSATIDTTGLLQVVGEPFSDPSGIVMIDPAAGTVRVNTAALLTEAYPGQYSNGLNGLAPNTELLIDQDAINGITNALTGALTDWIVRIDDALNAAVNAIMVRTSIIINLSYDQGLLGLLNLGTITATIGDNTEPMLADLRSGTIPATVTTKLNLGILGPLLNGLVSGLINALINNLGVTVAGAVDTALAALKAVPDAVADLSHPIVAAVGDLYGTLFDGGVVSLTTNAQNHPFDGGPAPEDWQNLPTGQYDVAALRIGVLGATPDKDIHVYLGRGSVGPICTRAGRCIDY